MKVDQATESEWLCESGRQYIYVISSNNYSNSSQSNKNKFISDFSESVHESFAIIIDK